MTAQSFGRSSAAEFVATTVVVLAGPGLLVMGGPDVGRVEVAIGFGLAYALAIGVIGAVANPMFSLTLFLARAIKKGELVADLLGQFLGAIFGAAILFGLNELTRFSNGTNGWQPGDSVDSGVDLGVNITGFAEFGVVAAAELVIGIVMVVVLLGSIRNQRSSAASAAFVGAGMAVSSLFLYGIDGVGVNPARSLGMAIFANTDPSALRQVWLFILVPFVASGIGLVVWLLVDEDTIDDTVFDDTFVEDAVDTVTDAVD